MRGLRKLIVEAHRRSLWQVLGIYLVGAWIAYQVVLALFEGLGLPDWVPPFALVLIIIGLPIVLATAFVQEGGPGVGDAKPEPSQLGVPAGGYDPTLHPELAGLTDASGTGPVGAAHSPAMTRDKPRGVLERTFTWKRAITGGVLAFALLGLATTGFMGMRALGIGPAATLLSAGTLDERDPILLADFEARGADTLLAAAVTDGFRVALEQSNVIRLYERDRVVGALRRMQRDPASKITPDLAREVAQREGLNAVLVGDVTLAAGAHVVTARLIDPTSARVLASFRETADEPTEVIAAVDALAGDVRRKIGDSLKDIRRSEPLEQVTTPSLEALQLYSRAERLFTGGLDNERVIVLLKEAIARDSTFAMAWRKLGAAYQNLNDQTRMVEALTRAYELRDRLPSRERHHAVAIYAAEVEWDSEKAIDAYRALLELSPDDAAAWNNLGLNYFYLGQMERAIEGYAQAIRADSTRASTYRNLSWVLINTGRVDEAQRVFDAYRRRWPDAHYGRALALLARARQDWSGAERALEQQATDSELSAPLRAEAWAELARFNNIRGRYRDADRAIDRAAGLGGRAAVPEATLRLVVNTAMDRVRDTGDAGRSIGSVERALERFPLAAINPLDRPHSELAVFFAIVGDDKRAREYLDRFERDIVAARPPAFAGMTPAPHLVRSFIALDEGNGDEALRQLRRAHAIPGPCLICTDAEAGYVFDRLGYADSALVRYTAVAAHPSVNVGIGSGWLPYVLERLGQLHDERGEFERAAEHYARFVEFWSDADPELQPRVQQARRRLDQLTARRG